MVSLLSFLKSRLVNGKPFRIGSDFGFVQLLKFQSASLDEPTRLFILEEMFNHWLNDVSESLLGSFK